ncbi:ABC transporter ATP-binding protein [Puniceicoccus vermicola]|uniref:ABC transporter ATP-binding protein n=1 Tax=Puniceicoccus vermicola TaxID=388746 RepID=A0A7X1E670_9BACT|nr:ABC transporter ATP-binding protein [Puniceicoccus vermicola]MBC2603919.1 ABC transporter ATP-binding protein [Puniceicoccus vermicola]
MKNSVDPAAIRFEGVSHRYGKSPSVTDISFSIQPGEIVCLLGPSGCGKTTILRLASGLEAPETGKIFIAGNQVANGPKVSPPEKRPISMVFQDYALFPHLTVIQNVVFGLKRVSPQERYRRATQVLEHVGLGTSHDRFPHTLSGGQQQRVALARAIALRPALMLMDEPFSNLDINLRFSVREETRRILHGEGSATILVTHDGEEAAQLADRILLLDHGHIVQEGSPEDFYFRPATPFAARFFGETASLSGIVENGLLKSALGEWEAPSEISSGSVDVVIRDQAFVFREPHEAPDYHLCFEAKIHESRVMGGRRVTEFQPLIPTCENLRFRAFHRMTTRIKAGETRPCWIDRRLVFAFPKGTGE